MVQQLKWLIDEGEIQALRDEAYEMACQRAREEGDVDIDQDYEIMEEWQDRYYEYLCEKKGYII